MGYIIREDLRFLGMLLFSVFRLTLGKMEINEEALNIRLTELDSLLQSTGYARQKSKFQLELEGFLRTLTPSRTLADAFPLDIRKFLALKDQEGKTCAGMFF